MSTESSYSSSSWPAVAIAILNWNGKAFLETYLPSVFGITYPNYQVYVIDNASSDGSVQWLLANYPQVKLIETGANYGFAEGYNVGISQLQEPYVLMLNSDVRVAPGFLEPLVQCMQEDAAVAMVQSKMLAEKQPTHFEYGGAAGGMIDVLGYSFCRGRLVDVVEQDNGQYNAKMQVFWAGGACSLIRRSCYVEVGGMYAGYFMHFEEIDLCWQFQSRGWSVMCEPASVIWHVGGGTLSYQSPRKTILNFRNNVMMVLRNAPWYDLVWWVPLRFGLDLGAALQYAMGGKQNLALCPIQAWMQVLGWLFSGQRRFAPQTSSLWRLPAVFKPSLLWHYFIKKHKKYSQLPQHLHAPQ